MLLIAAGSLWLFLAAVPALADGGPHVASINNGSTSLTADSCAGCHRAHTAQGAMLLTVPEEELCESCHGDAVPGATTDVWSGVQYALGADGLRDQAATLGALRSGGFESTLIGDPVKKVVGTSTYAKVTVGASAPVTSAHLDMTGTLGQLSIAWGNGTPADGAGPAAAIECTSCHNVHGNGQYRILNRIPEGDGTDDAWVVDIYDFNNGVYKSAASHGLLNGDTVTVAGNSLAGANVTGIVTIVDDPGDADLLADDDLFFTVAGAPATGTGTGGTVTRSTAAGVGGVKVTDFPLATDIPDGDARNYTVIQTLASAPTLLASEAETYDPTDGDYFHYRIPWDGTGALNTGYNYDAPNAQTGTAITVSGRSSIAVGDRSFSQEITAWCTSCHTRYWAWSQPTTDPSDGTTGAAYNTPRPGDNVFTYQHRTRGSSNRGCNTCHVSHGSSAEMTGFAADVPFPGETAGSDNSRMLKVDDRGTCQLCHDPTETLTLLGDGLYGPDGPITTDPGRP